MTTLLQTEVKMKNPTIPGFGEMRDKTKSPRYRIPPDVWAQLTSTQCTKFLSLKDNEARKKFHQDVGQGTKNPEKVSPASEKPDTSLTPNWKSPNKV